MNPITLSRTTFSGGNGVNTIQIPGYEFEVPTKIDVFKTVNLVVQAQEISSTTAINFIDSVYMDESVNFTNNLNLNENQLQKVLRETTIYYKDLLSVLYFRMYRESLQKPLPALWVCPCCNKKGAIFYQKDRRQDPDFHFTCTEPFRTKRHGIWITNRLAQSSIITELERQSLITEIMSMDIDFEERVAI
jgi:hypothetical protein